MRVSVPTLPATLPEDLLAKLRGIHVLIVDEERYFREVLVRILRHVHITQIMQAGSIAEARKILEKKKVSLVLSDYKLPDGTGLDLVRHVRADGSQDRYMPVILLTGELDRPLLRKAINGGVDDCMVKPLRPITLYQRIAKLVHQPPVYVDIPGVYFGPDRRRRVDEIETIEDRRKKDAVVARHSGGIILDEERGEDEAPDAAQASASGT